MSDHLPAIPGVDPSLLAAHEREHALLETERTSCDPAIDVVFRRFAMETTAHAVAGIAPSFRGGAGPPLLPVPRAFLSAHDLARIDGVRAALSYVDSRLAMVAQGHETASFRAESPYVLHALAEGRVDNPRFTNPGMTRATQVWQTAALFIYPEPREVRALLEESIAMAASSSAPACVRAAWLLFTTIYIHPFCDGNGRVSRLVYLLITGEQLTSGCDWGVAEQWAARRETFIELPGNARNLDTTLDLAANVAFVTRASVDGAILMRHRLRALTTMHAELTRTLACDPADAAAAVALAVRHQVGADVLSGDLGIGYDAALDRLARLVDAGIVRRIPTPPSRRRPGPSRPSFALDTRGIDLVSAVLAGITAPVNS